MLVMSLLKFLCGNASYTEKGNQMLKNFAFLVCQPYNVSIFASYNVLKFMNHFCNFIALFTFLRFILQLFVFMSFNIYDWLVKFLLYFSIWYSCINVCFWDALQVLKLKINLWLKCYLKLSSAKWRYI